MQIRRPLLSCLPWLALAAPLLHHQLAEACEPGVCFRDTVGDDVTQRPLQAPVFVRYDATPGSVPTTAEFVATGGSNVAATIEIFPSGEATEVRHHVVMVLPTTPLTAGMTYNMRITTDAPACGQFEEFSFTADDISLADPPALALAEAGVTSEMLAPDPISDCSDQDPHSTSFSVTPTHAGDGAALYALRVRDTYPGSAAESVYPDYTIADVRSDLPLRYDAVTNVSITTSRNICFVAAAISGQGQFGADSEEVCVTLEAEAPVCPGDSDACAEDGDAGCGSCASGGDNDASAPAWLLGGALVLGWLRRRA